MSNLLKPLLQCEEFFLVKIIGTIANNEKQYHVQRKKYPGKIMICRHSGRYGKDALPDIYAVGKHADLNQEFAV